MAPCPHTWPDFPPCVRAHTFADGLCTCCVAEPSVLRASSRLAQSRTPRGGGTAKGCMYLILAHYRAGECSAVRLVSIWTAPGQPCHAHTCGYTGSRIHSLAVWTPPFAPRVLHTPAILHGPGTAEMSTLRELSVHSKALQGSHSWPISCTFSHSRLRVFQIQHSSAASHCYRKL